MRLFPKPKVLTLEDWLEIATRKLAEPAKERIRAEIEAHYAEAVEAHREDGLSETDAQAAALAELGNPRAAGRRFRKSHLTEREAEWLKKFDEQAGKLNELFLCYAIFCLLTLGSISQDIIDNFHHASLFFALAFIILVLSRSFSFIAARRKAKRLLLSVHCITYFLFYIPVYQMFEAFSARDAVRQWAFFIIFTTILFRVWIPLRIWMKLGKMETGWNHNRPAGTA